MNKNELKALRDALPRVMKYERINKKLKDTIGREYSEGSISQILNGNRENKEVLIAAYEVAKEHQDELKEAREAFKESKHE